MTVTGRMSAFYGRRRATESQHGLFLACAPLRRANIQKPGSLTPSCGLEPGHTSAFLGVLPKMNETKGTTPRAIGLTFVSFAHMMQHYRDKPLNVPLASLRNLPEDIWQAVLAVVTTPPLSDFLSVGLSLSPQVPPLPEQATA